VQVPRVVSAALVLVAIGSGCSDQPPESPGGRAVTAYEAVIRWLVDRVDADPDADAAPDTEVQRVAVFVEPRGEGTEIDLEVQAGVIAATDDVADVSFIDSRDEALVDTDDGRVVADGGLLIRLPSVYDEGTSLELDVDVHVRDEEFSSWRFELEQSDDGWRIVGLPEQIQIDG
jgi:hypothetical protein